MVEALVRLEVRSSPPNREDELEIDSAIAVHEGFVLACTEHDRLQVLTKSLVQNANDSDIETVKGLVEEYIAEEKTIILVTIPASGLSRRPLYTD